MQRRVICQTCWFLAVPEKRLAGSPALELILWLLFLIPGALYAWWRHRRSFLVCTQCGSPMVVFEETPEAAALLASSPSAPSTQLPTVERASRTFATIPIFGGVGIVLVFFVSALFPEVRDAPWFWLAFWVVAL